MKIFNISIRKFGIASALLWLSFLIYLPPCRYKSALLVQELTVEFVKSYSLLFLGVLSGVLMFYHYRLGKIIALILAIIVLFIRITALFPNTFQKLYGLYVVMFKQNPLMVIHNDVIFPLFMVFTILYCAINRKDENL